MVLRQDDRLLKMRVPGALGDGPDVLLTSFSGHEAMSRLFKYELTFVSTNLNLDAGDLVGKEVGVELDRRDKDGNQLPPRRFHGHISRFSAGDVAQHTTENFKFRGYRAEMVPWLWFLTQTARSFIFFPEKEDKSIYEIIEEIFNRTKSDYHVDPKYDSSRINDLKQRKVKHCVQYRESDFNFISRTMEQYGVYYYFKHEKDKHEMVLGMSSNYPQCEESSVPFPRSTGSQSSGLITSWEHQYEFVSGKWEHTDYNFAEQPYNSPTNLLKNAPKHPAIEIQGNEKYEIYDAPGEFMSPGDSKSDADLRQEEQEVPHDVVQAASECKTFTPGHKFTLSDHHGADGEKKAYLITSIQHMATQPGAETGEIGLPATYFNQFHCIPASVQFRPARLTPKPLVSGINTAVVVGPKNEEIHTDKYGRVKVAFHWDRVAQKDQKKKKKGEDCCCWIRVAQDLAGKKWGFMAIPRIGQEVVVDFVEGDPDRPLIVGSVYNAEQMPHYDPETHKTKTYIKTNSSPGGDGFNELMFEDEKDKERVFIHAERDMDVRVKNVSKERVIADRHLIVGWEKDGRSGGDQNELVHGAKNMTVKKSKTEVVEGSLFVSVGGGQEDPGVFELYTEKKKKEYVGADGYHLTVDGARLTSVGGNDALTVGGERQVKVTGAHTLEADLIQLKGNNIVLEAGQELTLIAGGNFIQLGPTGISIEGTMVRVNCGGMATGVITTSVPGPEAASMAFAAEPAQAHNSTTGFKSAPDE